MTGFRAKAKTSIVLLSLASAPLSAQAPPDTGAFALITRNDLIFTAAFMAASYGVSRFDLRVARFLQDSSNLPSGFTTGSAQAFNAIGFPGAVVLTGGMYLAGKITGSESLADAGLHGGEAVVLAALATYAGKIAFGRKRPTPWGTGDPNDFKLGRGLRGETYSSFPSGHSALAFAAAGALTTEISSRSSGVAPFAAVPIFGAAALVAWARLESNKHWISDVFVGAGLGTMIGIKTVRWNHKHPANRLDRALLRGQGGVLEWTPALGLAWTWRPRWFTGRPGAMKVAPVVRMMPRSR